MTRGTTITKGASSSCNICFELVTTKDLIKLKCTHMVCKGCLRNLFQRACESEDNYPPRCCPSHPMYLKEDHPKDAEILTPELVARFREKVVEYETPAPRSYCSNEWCAQFLPPSRIRRGNHAKCAKCLQETCTTCGKQWHPKSDCPEDKGLKDTLEMAKINGWKRCHKCRSMLSKIEGCNHVVCRLCRAETCYKCGGPWGFTRQCTCPYMDTTTIFQTEVRDLEAYHARQARTTAQASADMPPAPQLAVTHPSPRDRALQALQDAHQAIQQRQQVRQVERVAAAERTRLLPEAAPDAGVEEMPNPHRDAVVARRNWNASWGRVNFNSREERDRYINRLYETWLEVRRLEALAGIEPPSEIDLQEASPPRPMATQQEMEREYNEELARLSELQEKRREPFQLYSARRDRAYEAFKRRRDAVRVAARAERAAELDRLLARQAVDNEADMRYYETRGAREEGARQSDREARRANVETERGGTQVFRIPVTRFTLGAPRGEAQHIPHFAQSRHTIAPIRRLSDPADVSTHGRPKRCHGCGDYH